MLKQLIQRLLDSRTTPSEAAHSAMPSSSYVTVTATAVQAWGEMAKGVAAFDGFVRVSARATSSNANVRVTNDTAAMFSQIEATASGQTQGVFVPVAKGDSWSVFGTNRDNPVVRVVKAIGGYNYLARRALSCLRALSNYLPRSFCEASILTLLINVGPVRQYRTKTFREEVNKISLPPLVAGPCFKLEELMTSPISGSDLKTPQERLAISLTPLVGGNGPRSRYRRVTQSLWILASTRVRGTLLLFATNRLNNLQTGGALC